LPREGELLLQRIRRSIRCPRSDRTHFRPPPGAATAPFWPHQA
jgi:hypothetical protein